MGVGGSCVREAQLGNEKCNPPLRTTTLYSHIHAHTYMHTRSPSLYPPLRKDRVEVVVLEWVKERERQGGGVGRDGEGDR